MSRFLRIARLRWRSLLRRDALDAELQRELAFHVDALTREHAAHGLSPADAARAAHRTIGNIALVADTCRDQRRVARLHDLVRDVGYGARLMWTRPGFTMMAAAAIGLGVGGTAALLGAITALRFGALPFADADRTVVIRTTAAAMPGRVQAATVLDYFTWKDRNHSFDAIGASLGWQADLDVEPNGAPPERVFGQTFTPSLFAILGAKPELGRVFTAADIVRGRPGVVVISHDLWQRRFGGDPNIVNTPIHMDRGVRIVVGVMPAGFRYQAPRVDFWIPLLMNRAQAGNPDRLFNVNAHLAPGVTLAQARADVAAIGDQLAREQPSRSGGWAARVDLLRMWLFGWTAAPLLTMAGACALLLLIGGLNVAALLLAHGVVRQREFAVRAALGAGRGRLRQQLLAEGVVVGASGGVFGVPVAWAALRELGAVMLPPPGSPALAPVGLGPGTIAIAFGLSLLVGLAVGLGPALVAPPQDLMRALREPAPSARSLVRPHRWRDALVAGQLAMAVVLLTGAGLLFNSLLHLRGRELNFDPQGVATLEMHLPTVAHPVASADGTPTFEFRPSPAITLQRVHEALRRVPGVTSAAGISHPLFTSLVLPTARLAAMADTDHTSGGLAGAKYFLVTPGFFTTLRASVIRGRDLTDDDDSSARWVAVINDTAARGLWPDADPIGQWITLDGVAGERPREVVGVVRDIPIRLRQATPIPVAYVPYLQQPVQSHAAMAGFHAQMMFLLRTAGDPASVLLAARRAVDGVVPGQPLTNVATMDDLRAAPELGVFVVVLGALACAAALLSAFGLYGVMVQSVNLRTREIGVRRALGADTRHILALFGRRTLLLTGVGWAAGAMASIPTARLLASQLWGVGPSDPATFTAVAFVIATVATGACAGPWWHAVAADPTAILKQE